MMAMMVSTGLKMTPYNVTNLSIHERGPDTGVQQLLDVLGILKCDQAGQVTVHVPCICEARTNHLRATRSLEFAGLSWQGRCWAMKPLFA